MYPPDYCVGSLLLLHAENPQQLFSPPQTCTHACSSGVLSDSRCRVLSLLFRFLHFLYLFSEHIMHSNPKMPNFNQTECSQTSLLSESNFLIESHLASLKLHIITTSDSSDSSAKSCCRSKYMDAVSAVTNYQRVTLGTACLIFSSQHFHDGQAVHFYERFGCFRVSLVLISLVVFILNFLLIILSIFSYFLLCQHISVPHTS